MAAALTAKGGQHDEPAGSASRPRARTCVPAELASPASAGGALGEPVLDQGARGLEIARGVRQCLADEGRFIAYQLRDRVGVLALDFGPAQVQFELLNSAAMWVYRRDKAATVSTEGRA